MKYKISLLIILAIATMLSLYSCSKDENSHSTINTSSSPNIIFIIADDMGWDVYGKYPGISGIKATTPTLDSLARTGITFTNFWSSPVCAPTRASILTGKYGFRTGVGGVQTPSTAVLQSNETIIQKYINDKTVNKYATAIIGKWHVSAANQLDAPESFGVGYYSGIFTGGVPSYTNWTQTSGGKQQNNTTYTTTHLVNQSVSWIQQQTKPFFLWLAFNAPHTPFHRPPLNLITDQTLSDNQASINSNPFPYYLASIEAMDKEIARLIKSLTAAQKENTVFVFIGDNGTPTQVAQTPYKTIGSKGTLYQGGINSPLLISGKNITRKNTVENAMVQGPDLFTTFADITGASSANYQDGISLKPLFTNANASKRTFAYSEQFGQSSPNSDGYTIRNINYKLIHLENNSEKLYNLSIDPFEEKNLLQTTLTTEAQQNLDELRKIKASL
ncbi:sulfatase-like hydrolase/transferase [Flavobacterium sp. K5-23]|uniref:sulfatase-like hydrolase/transferase n=1 Tax=Flavobacterium sp. K5-23 TaxID=2746225 RepID=UPI00200F29C4|nr:sulfatase-like hydrolase/transferase [Flavobacterium sp. K5-23]UQD54871.1 sulfatase-like hydrolase/transferase [Flavobacterium sp. K5-23]